MNKTKILKTVINVLLLFPIYGAGSLSYSEWTTNEACPKLLSIPVCYLIFFLFVLLMLVHNFEGKRSTPKE